MYSNHRTVLVVLAIGATFSVLVAAGCEQSEAESAVPVVESSNVVDDHSGWWCPEHGVPEAVCAQCNTRLAADFQKKGDWCAAHQRPESQCFICHPELEAKFAAQYEARYGKQPPTRSTDGEVHADDSRK